ncbi:mitogen-activated protein kinase kinase kinase 3-like [Cucumis melo var. makuwa]|uniref:Mitogen-activated protein kinase kinase kinase 3-like n=2 Tax=Cucumis melo TaxID=3656 RepID=A0A5A7UJ61_CUCMM|nr:mitogen-activated protein kinase kinase kinase 3-like [Cucumis melo var. makuwa]TYK25628.1 mitogen-activated protein kinase kinase kinase 3-like [Cucumis melo var. makuwa]
MAVKSLELVCFASLKNEKQVMDVLGYDCPQIMRYSGESCSVKNGEELYNLFLEHVLVGAAIVDGQNLRFNGTQGFGPKKIKELGKGKKW